MAFCNLIVQARLVSVPSFCLSSGKWRGLFLPSDVVLESVTYGGTINAGEGRYFIVYISHLHCIWSAQKCRTISKIQASCLFLPIIPDPSHPSEIWGTVLYLAVWRHHIVRGLVWYLPSARAACGLWSVKWRLKTPWHGYRRGYASFVSRASFVSSLSSVGCI